MDYRKLYPVLNEYPGFPRLIRFWKDYYGVACPDLQECVKELVGFLDTFCADLNTEQFDTFREAATLILPWSDNKELILEHEEEMETINVCMCDPFDCGIVGGVYEYYEMRFYRFCRYGCGSRSEKAVRKYHVPIAELRVTNLWKLSDDGSWIDTGEKFDYERKTEQRTKEGACKPDGRRFR